MRLSPLLALIATCATAAYGAVNIAVYQAFDDVVFDLSGSVDLTALSYSGTFAQGGGMIPSFGQFTSNVPGTDLIDMDLYSGAIDGPMSFGDGMTFHFDTMTGDIFGIGAGYMALSTGYSSGDTLMSTFAVENATLASLGLDEGVYTYNWGSGASADSATFTISQQGPAVPEPTTYALLGGLAALGFAAWRRRRA